MQTICWGGPEPELRDLEAGVHSPVAPSACELITGIKASQIVTLNVRGTFGKHSLWLEKK